MYFGGIRKQTAKNTGTSLCSVDHYFKNEVLKPYKQGKVLRNPSFCAQIDNNLENSKLLLFSLSGLKLFCKLMGSFSHDFFIGLLYCQPFQYCPL